MKINMPITERERTFSKGDDLITTTNRKGAITYFNEHFLNISGFEKDELLNKNHNVVRHPDMPPAAFEDLWKTIKSGRSCVGIVKNRAKNGDHYYVDAYVTPIVRDGEVAEYQSVRTVPARESVDRADKLYSKLRAGKAPIGRWQKLGFTTRIMGALTTLLLALLAGGAAAGQLTWVTGMTALVAGLGLSFALARVVAAPLVRLAADTRGIADNDIACAVYSGRVDEIGQLRLALHMRELEINSVVARLKDSMGDLDQTVSQTSQMVRDAAAGVATQQSEISQVATAMHEMSCTVQEVARNTSDAADAARKADAEVGAGRDEVNATITVIQEASGKVNEANEIVKRLREQSDSIGAVLDVIRSIAEQTNLLALNAAIEAARAGEQGRGFAVVADEVRSLASRTQESTQEIQQMIENIQDGARSAATAMESGCSHVETGVGQVQKTGDSLVRIADAVHVISDMNLQIASAAEEQSAVAEEINRNVVNINAAAEENATRSSASEQTIKELSEFAGYLSGLVNQFSRRSA